MREESDNDQNQSDDGDAETSPTKSPTTPKSVKSKNSSGTAHQPRTANRFQMLCEMQVGEGSRSG